MLEVLLAASLLQTPAAPPTLADVRARLMTYEESLAKGGPVPEDELASIASAVVSQVAASEHADAALEACSSDYWSAPSCRERLWATAKQTTAEVRHRARAAAALARRGEKGARELLAGIVKALPRTRLAEVAPVLPLLPAEQSVPLLTVMLTGSNPGEQVVACRTLAEIDDASSREAVAAYTQSSPRGTPSWFACTLAAAKLGDPLAQRMAGYLTNHLSGDDLIEAAEILMADDRERAIGILMQVTRESRGFPQLDAADRLATERPEIAEDVMAQGLASGRPELVAAALEVHRSLRLAPSADVRARLADADPLVRLRAAETVLAAERRRRGAAAVPASRPLAN